MIDLGLILGLAFAAPADDVAANVAELGDARYVVRERAERRLWELGTAAESAVRAAANSPDAEVARRARQLVEKYDWGIYPDTPAEVAREIGRFRGGDEENRMLA